jgi:hypothetical protein
MKNKVFSAVLCSVLAAGALSSCTNSFEDWNTNPNEVTPDEMLQDNLATGANYSTMQRGVFTVGKDNGGTYQITQMLTGDIFAGYFADLKGTYNIGNLHLDHYYMVSHWYNMPFAQANTRIMEPYRQICTFADENSVDRAMATVVRVFGMHRITDKYGPIIYSKFGTDVQAGYDSQEAIYKSFFEELDHAIEILGTYVDHNPGSTYMSSYDNVYYGDVARWVKFANTLRLRLAMRVSYVNKALATEQAKAAINESHGLMSSTSDDAYLHQGNGLTFTNSIWEVTQSWADLGMSATADCYLNGYNDPRLEKYYVKNSEGAYRGARNGVVNPQSALLQTKVSAGNFNQGSDQPWMFSAEAYFLQAEAKLRLGVGNASVKDLYEQGVRASFATAGAAGVDTYLQSTALPLSSWENPQTDRSIDVSSMLSMVTPAFDESASEEKQLEQIITQKWIALYPDGQEAWSEIRRTGYPGWVRIDSYSNTSEVTENDIIRRLRFPSTEYTDNGANVTEAVRLLGGSDIAGTHLWWDAK